VSIALGQHTSWTGAGPGTFASSSLTTAASGSTFVIFCDVETAAFTGVSDSKSNVWTPFSGPPSSFGNTAFAYYCENATGGAGHTFSATASAGFPSMWVVEITGGLTSGIVDGTPAKQADASSPFSAGGITTSQADELLLAFCGTDAGGSVTHTHGNSFTEIDAITDGSNFWTGATSYKVVSSTNTYDTSVATNTGANSMNWLIGFKAAAATGSTPGAAWQQRGGVGVMVSM
jgi:hypothetical protein